MIDRHLPLADYARHIGASIGLSPWYLMDQARIDRFADVTEDPQFIHVDPVAAAATPFGGTIAHGFLSLSMLSVMANQAIPPAFRDGVTINYGMNSLRFLKPVPSGRRIRGRFVLKAMRERAPGRYQSNLDVSVEIEGEEQPALAAEWLILTIPGGAAQ